MAKNQLDKLVDLKSMTKADARVAICKDVLAAIKAKKIVAQAGTYCLMEFGDAVTPDTRTSLRDLIPKMKRCDVCAIGAIFTAFVSRENKFDVTAEPSDFGGAYVSIGDERMIDKLRGYFGAKELRTIEAAFEGGTSLGHLNLVGRDTELKCAEFFERHPDDEQRLQAICRNIIRHEGEFIP